MTKKGLSARAPASTEGAPKADWNELQFLSWKEFKRMAPSILRLEVTRLGGLMGASAANTEWHNNLVRARFALTRFITCLEQANKETVEATCAPRLHEAIMNLSVEPEQMDPQTKKTCSYVLDRLKYVYDRIRLIY